MNGINRLDIKQLRVLRDLLVERNLSRVANKMGITQQAVSEQLRKLRDLFDDPLFVRSNNGVIPTPLALAMGDKIKQILRDIESLLVEPSFDPARYKGVFNISATDYAIKAVLPCLLKKIRLLAPELKLVVHHFETEKFQQLMESGELDLALTFPTFIPKSYPSLLLFHEHHVCVAAIDSPLLQRSLSITEIAALPQLIITPSQANLRGSHDTWFAEQGLKRNIVMSVPSFSAAPDIIAAAGIIAFLPSRLLPNDKVKPLALNVTLPSFDVIAAWHSRSSHSAIHKWVISLLKEVFIKDAQGANCAPSNPDRI